ncbi:MAG: hypothetical protein ACXWUG_09175 [Polyangiales bacterium]
MKRILLGLCVFSLAGSADAASSAKYKMKGPCHVRTTEGMPFDETFDRELEATISGPNDKVKVVVTGKGHAPCTLEGKRAGAVITLTPLQTCAQNVTRDGVTVDAKGVLASGQATVKGKTIALVTKWNVEGTVKAPFKMPVKGIIDTDMKGTRE